jgi:flagellin-like hook-associated protein FlgL
MSSISVTGNTLFPASYAQTLSKLKSTLDQLSNQLATGQKATDYAGLGGARTTVLSVQDQLNTIAGYGQNISTVQLRLNAMQSAIGGLNQVVSDMKSGPLDPGNYQLDGSRTVSQGIASTELDSAVAMLNTDVAGHYLFGGREVSDPPVVSSDVMMNGRGSQAGFQQVVDERKAADLGAAGNGRLAVDVPAAAPNTVTVAATGGAFGFQVQSGSASGSAIGVAVVPMAPSSATITLNAQPAAGDAVRLTLGMPDGTTTDVTLTAVAAGATPGAGQFAIGATADDTATNLKDALAQSVQAAAQTELVPASAMAAAHDFFESDPPQRVDIPAGGSAADATALRDGSAADTVIWYQGDDGGASPRATQSARVDSDLSVAYGAGADEAGPRSILEGLAVMSAVTFADAGANGAPRYQALVDRVNTTLTGGGDLGPLGALSTDLAAVQQTVSNAQSRQSSSQSMLQGILSSAEGVDTSDVAAQLLTAQTQLQASYQATAMLSKLSLVNFLG